MPRQHLRALFRDSSFKVSVDKSLQRTHIAYRSEVDASRRGVCTKIWVTLALAFAAVVGVAFAFPRVFGKALAADLAERLLEAALEAGLFKKIFE